MGRAGAWRGGWGDGTLAARGCLEPNALNEGGGQIGSSSGAAPGGGEAVVHPGMANLEPAVRVERFSLWYGERQVMRGADLIVPAGAITALMGPANCGKSSLLRSVNRLNDLIEEVRTEGDIRLYGQSVYDAAVDVEGVRQRVGMVFKKPNAFPMSVYENAVYGLRLAGERSKGVLDERCERALRLAALWDEVRERLHESALSLTRGQRQRLCVARAVAVEPDALLLDEPCARLDPMATARLEEVLHRLKRRCAVLLVAGDSQQASRAGDYTAFMHGGRVLEAGPTAELFTKPRLRETEDYMRGRLG